ncbi:hypothetical protein SVIO_000470 [Streptomyces violaceusniger]|uniref:Uncharacterized protein n=1 Tax=Streptomyces violaceusniger TaxID=68280 RepID=A0A4D4KMJ7_STRVO|nr:hypothetical protein SVIO_000470 [Streptomyces violaceusniger]
MANTLRSIAGLSDTSLLSLPAGPARRVHAHRDLRIAFRDSAVTHVMLVVTPLLRASDAPVFVTPLIPNSRTRQVFWVNIRAAGAVHHVPLEPPA